VHCHLDSTVGGQHTSHNKNWEHAATATFSAEQTPVPQQQTFSAASRTVRESLLSESRSKATVSSASRLPLALASTAFVAFRAGRDVGSGGSRFN
jgi:hypothetical protein